MALATNFILFQLGWFACVLGAAWGRPWVGVVAVILIVAWHLARAASPGREALLVIGCAVLGAIFENVLVSTGWVRFEANEIAGGLAPIWMIALWALFGTTLNVSLRWLHSRPLIAALLGAIGGPLAYYAGARMGAMELAAFGAALGAIALGWAIITPILVGAARRLDGYTAA